jgi:type I restriction enzyme S subunit
MTMPESWRALRLGDVCKISSGDGAPQEDSWFSEDGEPFVRVSDLSKSRGSSRISHSRDKVTVEAIEKLRLRKWRKDSLLLPKSGASALLNQRALLGLDACVVSHLAILEPTEFIDADFLYMWSTTFDAARVVPDPSYPSIRLQDLERVKIELPTLPEQKRIVELLARAERFGQVNERHGYLDEVIKAALDQLVLGSDESGWEQLGSLADTRYGTSVSADATSDTGAPVLRIPNVMGGEVDITDMKYVELTQAELDRLRLTAADVLIVRSNGNPEYVGRSAPITEDVCQSLMVYASYLIRLRTDGVRLLPEYLSAFLNSAYGRAAMRNAIRTTAGQSNLSAENLAKVRLPVPEIEAQKRFRQLWLQIREIRRLVTRSEQAAVALRSALSIDALSGDLTAQWRKHHADALAEAALSRDQVLRERGAKIAIGTTSTVPSTVQAELTVRPARYWLLGELSEFQRQVLAAFTAYSQAVGEPLLVEDPDVFARFCDETAVTERLQAFGDSQGNRIRRTLSQLAAVGLIAKVTLPKIDQETGEHDYLKAFRPLREDEFTRLADVQALRKAFAPNIGGEGS